MSLNNRIAIRDTYVSHGAVEVRACPNSSSRSETTVDSLHLESEKQQKQTMKYPQTKVEAVGERVIGEPRDLRFTVYLMPCAVHSAADIA